MTLIYQNIKYLREKQHMSQGELADLCGYTNRSSITRVEKGQVDLQYSKIEILLRNLSILCFLFWHCHKGKIFRFV